jgi:hypothetical protein
MSKGTARRFAGAALAVALAGCAADDYLGKPKEPEPNIMPVEYRRQITDTMTPLLDDPTNVKDAFISDPALMTIGKEQRYVVCIRSNSRDGARQYTGSKDRIAVFFAGRLNQLVDARKEQCGNAAYRPFPELEKLCLGASCT